MTTAVWCELVCAQCSTTAGGRYSYNGSIPMKPLKQAAKKAGWVFACDEAFCSKQCAEQYHQDSAPEETP